MDCSLFDVISRRVTSSCTSPPVCVKSASSKWCLSGSRSTCGYIHFLAETSAIVARPTNFELAVVFQFLLWSALISFIKTRVDSREWLMPFRSELCVHPFAIAVAKRIETEWMREFSNYGDSCCTGRSKMEDLHLKFQLWTNPPSVFWERVLGRVVFRQENGDGERLKKVQ